MKIFPLVATRTGHVLWLLAIALAVVRCGGDPTSPAPSTPVVHRFAALTERADVLENLELAYNLRRSDRIDQLLDEHFVFFLSASDLGYGYPAQWDRALELEYTSELFDPHNGIFDFTKISFHLELDGPPEWEAMASPDSLPSETWFRSAVNYNFRFEMEGGYAYYNTSSPALFIVRNAGTTRAPHWQLVYCRDLASGCLFAEDERHFAQTAHPCPEHSWGSMKAMYSLACAPGCAPPP